MCYKKGCERPARNRFKTEKNGEYDGYVHLCNEHAEELIKKIEEWRAEPCAKK